LASERHRANFLSAPLAAADGFDARLPLSLRIRDLASRLRVIGLDDPPREWRRR
jgi:hypothetical protein